MRATSHNIGRAVASDTSEEAAGVLGGSPARGLPSARPTPCPCQWRDRPPGEGKEPATCLADLPPAACAVALVTLAACGSSATSSPAVTAPSSAQVTSPSVPALPAVSATPIAAAPCTKRDLRFDPANMDLTGPWLANDDGMYYLRQIEDALWWSGMSGQAGPPETLGREWNNVAFGRIRDDLTIELLWADLPRAWTSWAMGPLSGRSLTTDLGIQN